MKNKSNEIHFYKKYFIFIIFFFLFSYTYSQTTFSLSLSQSAINDWRTGEVKSIELASSFDTKNLLRLDTMLINLNYKFAFGALYEKIADSVPAQLRPSDNVIYGEIVLRYQLGWVLDPFVSSSVETQIAESFMYVKGRLSPTSAFWDPVISQESFGLAYSYYTDLSLLSRIGVSLKQTRAEIYTKLTDDLKTTNIKEAYKPESGIQWKTETYFNIDSVVFYKGLLDSFGTFKNLDVWSIKFENEFQIKILKYFGVILRADFIYDEKQKRELQYKQNIRFGFIAMI
ncbi:MAG: hypothetical protein A2X61_04610 [Ignavibacteria bacterium GWB2_35_12]|nr:MAG: hypothetical protein A2X63_13405 [Ignavibacteria bacterium GWA2_35_8]OGU41912.1 MAG: hypothetical protein A2X61_04610 [Ignavibacteria bacterium GWB2_35_12]OGU87181.1 MAG: hypothetical protein A2220_07855 [Ignavibacteria bacterium RIFOXYA2_FULL_35_10]OGV24586.1 MAG: hypothetical protein A2475_09200 [Ignavibacteria bacterium RIFOXYC2_FULL_35_21]